mgnify:CR=1 FL=1
MSVDTEKKEMRMTAKDKRRSLAGQAGSEAGDKLAVNFFKSAPGASENLQTIAGYWPIADEIDVRPLMTKIHEAGRSVVLPVVVKPEQPLAFRPWRPDMALEEGAFGTYHPGSEEPEVSPDALLVPLLAFDDRGFRLGWGGGFYDHTLAGLRAAGPVTAIGAAYHGQMVDHVPHDTGDEPLDWIITDEDILEAARP